MKKTMMAMAMAAMTIASAGTALAATPEEGNFHGSTPRIEMNYAHCSGGYYGGGHGGRGGYGCGDGYCWGENSEG